jgi:hypothetical protein
VDFSGHLESCESGAAVGKELAWRKGVFGDDISHQILLVVR